VCKNAPPEWSNQLPHPPPGGPVRAENRLSLEMCFDTAPYVASEGRQRLFEIVGLPADGDQAAGRDDFSFFPSGSKILSA
jgi:hypothetical protein